jgi:hypothetical protein
LTTSAPAVLNQHERTFACDVDRLAPLIEGLASDDDRLWPHGPWPPMFFDRPLGVGASGGHGLMRYAVSDYEKGSRIRFRYLWPRKFDGFHEFAVHRDPAGRAVLRHTVAMTPRGLSRLLWWSYVRPLHDACIEDSLDRAELAVGGAVADPARWSIYVRLLHKVRIRRYWP